MYWFTKNSNPKQINEENPPKHCHERLSEELRVFLWSNKHQTWTYRITDTYVGEDLIVLFNPVDGWNEILVCLNLRKENGMDFVVMVAK